MRLVAKTVVWASCHAGPPDQRPHRGGSIAGTALLVSTIGRRTGKRRIRPLAYLRDGERLVLCTSNGGSPRHPGCYHNLCATGRAEIQVGPGLPLAPKAGSHLREVEQFVI
jgi:hypothetical protein